MQKVTSAKPTISSKVLNSQIQKVWTNHFDVSLNKKQQVFQLSVKFKPALPRDHNRTLDRLMQLAKKDLTAVLGKTYFTTADTIYSLKEIEDGVSIPVDNYLMTLQTTNTFAIGDINETDKHPVVNRFLNIVVKGYMESQGFKEYGKHASYFPTNEKPATIDQGISILRGFKITIDKYLDDSIKINIDTCFRISSTRSIFEEFTQCVKEARDKDSAKSRFTFENIVGKSFCIQNDFTRMVKIHGVDPKKNLKSPGPVDGYKSMKDYFEAVYKVKLYQHDQFIVFNEKKKLIAGQITCERTFYPSEILFGLGLKESQKKDFRLMKEIAAITKMRPEKKKQSIMDCSKLMKSICSDLDMKISPVQSNSQQTVVLTNPEYTVRNNKNLRAKDGIIFFKDQIYSKADFSNWAVVYESSDNFADRFYAHIEEAMEKLGVEVKEPYWYGMPDRPGLQDYKDALEDTKAQGCTFVVLIMGRFSAENLYKKVKEHADLKIQILTQVVKDNPKMFEKRGFFDKLVFQMCSKLGYPLWVVQKPAALQNSDTLLIGADVYHSKGKESVTAVIGTLNSDYSRFCSLSNVQAKRGQEIMDNLADMVLDCVMSYVDMNKRPPAKILFYRDGVGDTMMDLVTKYELTKIKEMLAEKFGKSCPKLSFVVVTKRISDKSLSLNQDGSVANPPSGTIISSGIIKKEMEFFMVAQNVTEGTATPTRYQVLLNECGYSHDDLHQITFFQAFNYYGWSGAVKVPAVCQYAHKLAYHVGENYRQSNKFMKYNLYYL
jgi:aubergine-like protein